MTLLIRLLAFSIVHMTMSTEGLHTCSLCECSATTFTFMFSHSREMYASFSVTMLTKGSTYMPRRLNPRRARKSSSSAMMDLPPDVGAK